MREVEPKTLVLFDFDGTITKGDTFVSFIVFSIGKYQSIMLFMRFFFYIIKMQFGMSDPGKVKEQIFKFAFIGKSKVEMESKGKIFIQWLYGNSNLNEEIVAKIHNHKKKNHEVCIVSASIDAWVRAFCENIEVDCLCTELEYLNNSFTGNFYTPNCNYEEKVNRILAKYDLNKFKEIIAYGNSKGDEAMFGLASTKIKI